MVDTPNQSSELKIYPQSDSKQNEANSSAQGLKLAEVEALIENKVAAAKQEVLQQNKNEIDRQIQIANASFITVFGIFASITSFLTIEFQFLKTLSNSMEIIGFTLILWSLLFSFNLALDYLVTNRLNQDKYRPNVYLSFIIIVLLIIGLMFIILSVISSRNL